MLGTPLVFAPDLSRISAAISKCKLIPGWPLIALHSKQICELFLLCLSFSGSKCSYLQYSAILHIKGKGVIWAREVKEGHLGWNQARKLYSTEIKAGK